MRSSYDSLFFRVKDQLKHDPFSGHLFLFVNRTRTSCKVLYTMGRGL
jgi:transposase